MHSSIALRAHARFFRLAVLIYILQDINRTQLYDPQLVVYEKYPVYLACPPPPDAAAAALFCMLFFIFTNKRYLTIPVLLAHLESSERSWTSLLVGTATCAGVNAVTIYVFLARPFTWHDGSLARFMW